jgi:hypothetical protein
VSHPIFARVYQRLSVVMDHAGGTEQRRALVAHVRGAATRPADRTHL